MLVLIAAAIAAIAGFRAAPPQDVPTYALDSSAVYKCEVTLALFLAQYLIVVAIALSAGGRTVGKITTTGFELPSDLSDSVFAQQALIERQDRTEQNLVERDGRLSGEIESIWDELEKIISRDAGSGS